jgi:hypothetical protein
MTIEELQNMLNEIAQKKFAKLSDRQLQSIENIVSLSKSDEWRNKTSKIHKGRKRSKETIKKQREKEFSKEHRENISIARGKIVFCYSYPNMEFIKEYHSTGVAAKDLNLTQSCVALTCIGKRKSTGGYTFRYKD